MLVNFKNLNVELEQLEELKKGMSMLEFNLQKCTGPQQRHKIIDLLEDMGKMLTNLRRRILEDLGTYGTGVKLIKDLKLYISPSWPTIINNYGKKYKQAHVDYRDSHEFKIPKGTLGIITSVYVTSTTLKYNIGIPDPITNKLSHGSVIKGVNLDTFTTALTDEEKKVVEKLQLNEVLKREQNNLMAIEKLQHL